MTTLKQAMIDGGVPEPRLTAIFVDRTDGVRGEGPLQISRLLRQGVEVPATFGPPINVKVALHDGPLCARLRTGWFEVIVKSQFGAISRLLFEPTGDASDGVVSGWLRIKGH